MTRALHDRQKLLTLSNAGRQFFHIRRLCDQKRTAWERRIHRLILRSKRPKKVLTSQYLSGQPGTGCSDLVCNFVTVNAGTDAESAALICNDLGNMRHEHETAEPIAVLCHQPTLALVTEGRPPNSNDKATADCEAGSIPRPRIFIVGR